MPGQILIIDALSNRRIQLRALLDTASYDVSLTETQAEALHHIRQTAPDVVIVAHDLPGLKLQPFCKLLRQNPKTQFTSVIVAVPRENHSARISALTAGAEDVIEYANDAGDLQARIRSYMRQTQSRQEARPVASPSPLPGFAEEQRCFEDPVTVTLVIDEDATVPVGLDGQPDFRMSVSFWRDARRAALSKSDVFVVFESAVPAENRNLLATLRSNAATCHAAVLYISRTGRPAADPSPLDLGAQDQAEATISDAELALRIRRLAQRKRDADRARAEMNTLGEMAYRDSLTGLCNRGFAARFLQEQDQMMDRGPASLSVLMIDIDHFKTINDTFGHAAGDSVLATLAEVLRANVRASDMVARMGGDEFLIALPQVGQAQALSVAERIRREIAARATSVDADTVVRITASIGLAVSTRSFRKSTSDLTRAADHALYRAKRTGRNQIGCASSDDFQMRRLTPAPSAAQAPVKVG